MISAIVLAAGESKRMGAMKQLLPVGGIPMIGRTIRTLLGSRLDEVILVTGFKSDKIRRVIDDSDRRVRVVVNKEYTRGMGSSIACGMKALSTSSEAVLIVLGDQPFIRVSTVNALIEAFEAQGHQIIYPVYQGKRGHPVLFAASFFPSLRALSGDRGGAEIVTSNRAKVTEIELPDEAVAVDLDTPEDLKSAQGRCEM